MADPISINYSAALKVAQSWLIKRMSMQTDKTKCDEINVFQS